MVSSSPASRWSGKHGYGGGKRRFARRFKIAYANQGAAIDQAVLMDLKHGVAFDAYPCRWGNNYRDGEVFAVHWHVGRVKEPRGDDETDIDE